MSKSKTIIVSILVVIILAGAVAVAYQLGKSAGGAVETPSSEPTGTTAAPGESDTSRSLTTDE